MVRTADFKDFFRLRRMVENPWEILRFRKKRRRGQTLEVRLLDGRRLYLRGASQDFHIFHRIYLRDEYRLAQHAGDTLGCVVDIGANVGLFAARVAPMAGRVICYEPLPENFAQLRRNVGGIANVLPVCQAVDGRRGTIRLYHPIRDNATGAFSKYAGEGSRLSDLYTEVASITLDDLFARHRIGFCDLLKFDVEGAEYDIFYAAGEDTLARIRRICGEYHHVQPYGPQGKVHELASFLRSKGFGVEIFPKPKKVNNGLFFAARDEHDEPKKTMGVRLR
jgi:FkbM family methyltransferase